jgi:hypothetical protein
MKEAAAIARAQQRTGADCVSLHRKSKKAESSGLHDLSEPGQGMQPSIISLTAGEL